MEYVFGTKGAAETLRTKHSSHTDLKGYHEITTEYPDQIITDRFRIVRKLESKEDTEHNCFDWYEIDSRYRVVDKFTPKEEEIETGITDTQDALCEESEYIEARLADIEDALCEVTEG